MWRFCVLDTFAGAFVRLLRGSDEALFLLPRPDSVDLNREPQAEHNPDGNDGRQHHHTLRGLVDYNGSNDIRDDEHFQTQQDDSSEMPSKVMIKRKLDGLG